MDANRRYRKLAISIELDSISLDFMILSRRLEITGFCGRLLHHDLRFLDPLQFPRLESPASNSFHSLSLRRSQKDATLREFKLPAIIKYKYARQIDRWCAFAFTFLPSPFRQLTFTSFIAASRNISRYFSVKRQSIYDKVVFIDRGTLIYPGWINSRKLDFTKLPKISGENGSTL